MIGFIKAVHRNYRALGICQELGKGIGRWLEEDIDTVITVTGERTADGGIQVRAVRSHKPEKAGAEA